MRKKFYYNFISRFLDKHLHIISLDVPLPANYGGVIDIFYKLKALSELGIKIHLHCFTRGRKPDPKLETYCASVDYYDRKINLPGLFSSLPYIVQSRASKKLIQNLNKDQHPILMEGMHCSYPLWMNIFPNRKMLLRLHNIEPVYYQRLALHEKNIFRKIYYRIEASRLVRYEKKIVNRAKLLAINPRDAAYYTDKLGAKEVQYLPAFSPWNQVCGLVGKSDYCMYHGNLSVNENEAAVRQLIENIFSKIPVSLVVAGSNPSAELIKTIDRFSNVRLHANPDAAELQTLIQHAQIHILPSLNATGIKLKLLHALYLGRHCVVNTATAEGTSLEPLLNIANSDEEMKQMILTLLSKAFTEEDLQQRSEYLEKIFNSKTQAERLSSWLW